MNVRKSKNPPEDGAVPSGTCGNANRHVRQCISRPSNPISVRAYVIIIYRAKKKNLTLIINN